MLNSHQYDPRIPSLCDPTARPAVLRPEFDRPCPSDVDQSASGALTRLLGAFGSADTSDEARVTNG